MLLQCPQSQGGQCQICIRPLERLNFPSVALEIVESLGNIVVLSSGCLLVAAPPPPPIPFYLLPSSCCSETESRDREARLQWFDALRGGGHLAPGTWQGNLKEGEEGEKGYRRTCWKVDSRPWRCKMVLTYNYDTARPGKGELSYLLWKHVDFSSDRSSLPNQGSKETKQPIMCLYVFTLAR